MTKNSTNAADISNSAPTETGELSADELRTVAGGACFPPIGTVPDFEITNSLSAKYGSAWYAIATGRSVVTYY